MYRLLLFLSFICNLNFCWASDRLPFSLKGKVLSKEGEPVLATIYLKDTKIITITSDDGSYRLEVPAGKNILVISALGYHSMEREININGNKENLDFVLSPSVTNLKEVTVVAKTESRKEREKGFAISSKRVNSEALTTIVTSELLNRISGVKLRQSGGEGSEIQYNINGLTGNSIRVFIDGIPMENYGASFSVSSIPPSMIERIDVYKGVVPSSLVDDALGGAINIVLKQQAKKSISTSYTFGSLNTHKWDLNANFRDDKTGFTVQGSAFFNHSDNDYKVWGTPIKITDAQTGKVEHIKAKRFHDGYQSKGIALNVGFTDVKWADRLLLGFIYSDMKKDIQHGATMEVVYGNRATRQDTYLGKIQYEKRELLPNLSVFTNLSYSSGRRHVIDTIPYMYQWTGEIMTDRNGHPIVWKKGGGEAGAATLAKNMEKMLSGRVRVSYEFIPMHSISANYYYNRFTRDVKDPYLTEAEQKFMDTRHLDKNILSISYDGKYFDDKAQVNLFYKFYQQKARLTDPIVKDGKVVAEKISRNIKDNGVGGAVSYKVFPTVMLTLSAEYAIRLPEVTELLGNTSYNIKPTYNLRPEKSTNLNFGALLGVFEKNGHELESDINVFYRDIKDMIQKSLINRNDEMYCHENLGKIRGKGVDAELRYNYAKKLFSSFKVSYNAIRFNLRYDEHGTEYIYYKDRLRNEPYLTFNWDVNYVQRNCFLRGASLNISYNLGYVHEFFRNWESLGGSGKAVIPSQLVHDLGLLYTFPRKQLSLGFDIRNLTNKQVFDNWALQKPGRMILGKVSYTFTK